MFTNQVLRYSPCPLPHIWEDAIATSVVVKLIALDQNGDSQRATRFDATRMSTNIIQAMRMEYYYTKNNSTMTTILCHNKSTHCTVIEAWMEDQCSSDCENWPNKHSRITSKEPASNRPPLKKINRSMSYDGRSRSNMTAGRSEESRKSLRKRPVK